MDATRLPPPAAEAPPAITAPTEATALPLLAGRYQAIAAPRESGTGLEFDAVDTQASEAPVTVKLLSPQTVPNSTVGDRILRESRQLTKGSSASLAKALEQGRSDDGQLYLVSERLSPISLEEWVQLEGVIPLGRACALVLSIGEALSEAQKLGVIHRDLTPRTVRVSTDGAIQVGDFTVAAPINDKLFGTPGYLAPEQIEGKAIDQRSNLYSLAAIFSFLVTGRHPFEGDPEAVMKATVSGDPPLPSRFNASLPVEFDRAIAKAMDRSPGRRHLTLRQLLSEVETLGRHPSAQMEAVQQASLDAPSAGGRQFKSTVMGMMTPFAAATPRVVNDIATDRVAPSAVSAKELDERAREDFKQTVRVAPPSGAELDAQASAEAARAAAEEAARAAAEQAARAAAEEAARAAAEEAARAAAEQAARVAAEEAARAAAEEAARQNSIATAVLAAGKLPNAPESAAAATVQAKAPSAEELRKAAPAAEPTKKPAANQPQGGGRRFRETGWFKAGELEEELSKAEAAAAAESDGDPLQATGRTGRHAAIDPNSVDLSAADQARLSLRSGATQTMPVYTPSDVSLPGDRMDEQEMLAEMDGSRKKFVVLGVVVALLLAVIAYFLTRQPAAEPAAKPAVGSLDGQRRPFEGAMASASARTVPGGRATSGA